MAGMLIGPLVIVSVYLMLSRWSARWFTTESDWWALAIAVAVGVVSISRLPISPLLRIVLAVWFVPFAWFALLFYSLAFLGLVFGDWL
jgi:hypothetical protein